MICNIFQTCAVQGWTLKQHENVQTRKLQLGSEVHKSVRIQPRIANRPKSYITQHMIVVTGMFLVFSPTHIYIGNI